MQFLLDLDFSSSSFLIRSDEKQHSREAVGTFPPSSDISHSFAASVSHFSLFVQMAIHAGVEESNQGTSTDEDHHHLVSVRAANGSSRHLGLSSSRLNLHGDVHAVHVSRCTRLLAHPVLMHVRAIASLVAVMMLWEGIW